MTLDEQVYRMEADILIGTAAQARELMHVGRQARERGLIPDVLWNALESRVFAVPPGGNGSSHRPSINPAHAVIGRALDNLVRIGDGDPRDGRVKQAIYELTRYLRDNR